jgi:hypothetical protein
MERENPPNPASAGKFLPKTREAEFEMLVLLLVLVLVLRLSLLSFLL